MKVYEDEMTLAFLDVQPVHAGHTLVVCKSAAAPNVLDISVDEWRARAESLRIVAAAVERATAAGGINILMNNRSHAGQVIDHAHVHLIPRFEGDGLEHWQKSPVAKDELTTVAEKIRAALVRGASR